MANLGSYYSERQQENHNANIKKSIQIFEEILMKLGKGLPLIDAASIMVNLANSYSKVIGIERQQKLEKAIDMLEKALSSFSFRDAPGLWAMAKNNLSAIYIQRINEEKNENIKRAIEANTRALEAFEKIGDRESWANAKLLQANLWMDYPYSNPSFNFKKAAVCVQEALDVYIPEHYPGKHAKALLLLSEIKRSRQNINRGADIEAFIDQVEKALLSNAIQNDRQLLISTLRELGDLYAERIEGNRSANMEKSIELLERAVRLIDQRSDPLQWGMVMNNLAQSYHSRVEGLRADNIEMAIALCEQAVFIITNKSYPDKHSYILETLGEGYRERLRGDKKENTKLAMQIFTAASAQRDKGQNPEAWLRLEKKYLLAERTWGNLNLTETDKKNAFVYDTEKYLSTLHENAKTISYENDQRTWIHAQIFLGDAYTRLMPIDVNFDDMERLFNAFLVNLEKAVGIYKSTLSVAKRMGDDFQWAIIQSRIGITYSLMYSFLGQLLKSKSYDVNGIKDNERVRLYYESSVTAYEKSLEICTVERLPRHHLSTAVSLGKLYTQQNNWDAANASFASASKAADLILGNVEICDSDARAILHDLGRMASLAPYVSLMLNQPGRAIELSERVKARLLAKALTLKSLPLSNAVRKKLHIKQDKVAALERKLLSPRLFNRKSPLEASLKLRIEIKDLIGPVDLDESLDNIDQLITKIISDHTVIVLPIMTNGEGRLVIIHNSNGSAEIDIFKCPSLDALQKILGLPNTQKLALVAKGEKKTRENFDELVTDVGFALGEVFATPLVNALESLGIKEGGHINILLQGSLGVLPLGLAYVKNTGKILLEHYEISMSPSLRVFEHVKKRKPIVPKSIIALANPDKTLPYSEVETSVLRKWFTADDIRNKYIEGIPIKN